MNRVPPSRVPDGLVLRTGRIELRPVRFAAQADALARVVEATDDAFAEPRTPQQRREHAERTVARSAAAFAAHGYGLWLLHRAGEDEPVGWCGLKDNDDPSRPELMYGLVTAVRGAGLASEAVRVLVAHALARPEVVHVWGAARPENVASLRVMARAGMALEGPRVLEGREYVVYRADPPASGSPRAR